MSFIMEIDPSDKEIVQRIGALLKEAGGNGNCLFYSVEYLVSSNPQLFEVIHSQAIHFSYRIETAK
jgi:hypothetical protein